MTDKSKYNKFSRRSFLTLIGASALSTIFYSYIRGVRFPKLSWEARQPIKQISTPTFKITLTDLIQTTSSSDSSKLLQFRAYAPEPRLFLRPKSNQTLRIKINNIATEAIFEYSPKQQQIKESQRGLTRYIEIHVTGTEPVTLSWKLPKLEHYSFAAIGDTGGDKELAWCIQRANKLGARFLLHLGDFNYQESDYESAIKLFNDAPLPCYVSIGNHDFHDNGLIYDKFLKEIGPFNHQFSIGKTRFVNIDTAANILPYWAGSRGELFKSLQTNSVAFTETVAFTHRPLYDPDLESENNHDIGSEGERDWLIEQLKNANIKTLLSGHIHIFNRQTFKGIDNIIIGQGLGHQDLITNSDYSKIAIGQVSPNGSVNYQFASLSMPMELHCHPRNDVVKASLKNAPHKDVINKINDSCGA